MAAYGEATILNALSYNIIPDGTGEPIIKLGTPDNQIAILQYWEVFGINDDTIPGGSGEYSITFQNTITNEFYIAARGTDNLGDTVS